MNSHVSTFLALSGTEIVGSGLANVAAPSGYKQADQILPMIVGTAINVILAILGVMFLALIVYAGFEWLLAAGDEKKVGTALNMLRHSIIGLIITLSAYVITVYVMNAFGSAAGFKP